MNVCSWKHFHTDGICHAQFLPPVFCSLPSVSLVSVLPLSLFLPFYSLPPPPSFCHAKEQVQAFVNVNVFLNILVTRLEDGSVAKSLPHIHDNLSLDPQHRYEKSRMMVHVYNPSLGSSGWWQRRRQADPRAYWSDNLAGSMSFKFNERPCLKNIRWRKIEEDTGWWL